MKWISWSLGFLLCVPLTLWAQTTLKEGSKAPPLKVAKWIKGKPVQRFEPGKVYVVEFWATWCGPCRRSIPHLTELAKKFKGKVTVIGVSIWENPRNSTSADYIPRVEQFVREMGAKMDYIVAVDDPKGTMARTWMTAAGQDGIPTAFVIDQQGRIVWIGHPMAELEEVLEQVVAGKFDWRKHAQERQARKRDQAALMQLFQRLNTLRRQKKYEDALKELEQAEKRYPAYKETFTILRYELLLFVDEQKAYALARQLANNQYKRNPDMLNMLAWSIVEDNPERTLKSPDYAPVHSGHARLRAVQAGQSGGSHPLSGEGGCPTEGAQGCTRRNPTRDRGAVGEVPQGTPLKPYWSVGARGMRPYQARDWVILVKEVYLCCYLRRRRKPANPASPTASASMLAGSGTLTATSSQPPMLSPGRRVNRHWNAAVASRGPSSVPTAGVLGRFVMALSVSPSRVPVHAAIW
jgi:thiol-disulfide isomerase/thioredoxin